MPTFDVASDAKTEAPSLTAILPQPKVQQGRLGFLDTGRALAALLVMLQHSMEGSQLQSLTPGSFAVDWLNLGQCGVAIFFLVSGFIIPASISEKTTFSSFWLRRVLRIYPLYSTVFLITLALYTLYLGINPPPTAILIISHIFMLQEWIGIQNYVGGSWTLLIEFIWYGLFASVVFFSGETKTKLVVSGLLVYFGILVFAVNIFERFPYGRVTLLALCLMGYLYLLRFRKEVALRPFLVLLAAFCILVAASTYFGFHDRTSANHFVLSARCVGISWFTAILIFSLIFRCRNHTITNLPIMRFLGEISYSLYLVHSPVIALLMALKITGPYFVILTFSISIPVSILTYRYIERPATKAGRRLTRKLEGHAPGA